MSYKYIKKTLFQRIKDIGRKSKEYLGKAHQFMIKDAGFRKTSKFAGYGRNITRNTFKNTMRGNTMRAINKVLPGKYKALAAIAAGTYLATRGKKNAGAGSGGAADVGTGAGFGASACAGAGAVLMLVVQALCLLLLPIYHQFALAVLYIPYQGN